MHDAFSIAELLYYEAFGFCPRGEGAALFLMGAGDINKLGDELAHRV